MSDEKRVENQSAEADSERISFATFLEVRPPGSGEVVYGALTFTIRMATTPPGTPKIATPDVQMHCGSDLCDGVRTFGCDEDEQVEEVGRSFLTFMRYECRNCKKTPVVFALGFRREREQTDGTAYVRKIGQLPPFGPPLPPRLISMIRGDRELFTKGRRAESQALGIGAFGYYRRVVESQFQQLVGQIARVAEREGASNEVIESLRAASRETQFSKAVESAKDLLPNSLRIRNQNPLTLLHSALSEGLHAKSDEECLELAADVRLVLTAFAEKVAQALDDERQLTNAVSRLLRRSQP